MGMTCNICNHSKRLQIDRDLVQGKNYQIIANTYGVDWQAVRRHKENHLSRQLTQAYERKEMAESMNLLAHIEDILDKANSIFNRNYEQKRDGLALKALAEQRSTIELLAKIGAYLHESRAMELQSQQGDYETRREQEEKEFINLVLDTLNPAEADLWEKLHQKIRGEFEGDVVEYTPTVWSEPSQAKPEPELVPEPEPEQSKPFRRTVQPYDKYRVQTVESQRIRPYSKTPKRVHP